MPCLLAHAQLPHHPPTSHITCTVPTMDITSLPQFKSDPPTEEAPAPIIEIQEKLGFFIISVSKQYGGERETITTKGGGILESAK